MSHDEIIVEENQDWRLTSVRNEPTTAAALAAWEPAPVFEIDLRESDHRDYVADEDDYGAEATA